MRFTVERGAVCPWQPFMSESAIYQIKAMALLAALASLFILCGWGLAGRTGLLVTSFISVIACTGIYLLGGRCVLRMHRAQRINEKHAPGLFRMVRNLARQTDSSVPSVYVLPERSANAFATGRSGKHGAIAVSAGLLELLDGEELAAVIAHEFAHLQQGHTLLMTIVAAVAASLTSLANVFTWSNLLPNTRPKMERHDGVPSDAFFWVLIAPFAAMLIRLSLSNSREYLADEQSARMIGDPNPLLRAVIKIDAQRLHPPLLSVSPATAHLFICNPLSSNGLIRLFETHPPVSKRVDRLEALARRRVAC
jgi:heat shock protein HtpX